MAANAKTMTPKAIKALKPGKHFVGGGLYLLVQPNGRRYWRMKYRHGGRERLLSFGVYPEVSLAEARARRDDARTAMRDGADPGATRRAIKVAAQIGAVESFKALADEWLAKQRGSLAASTYEKAGWMIGLVPTLHGLPVAAIKPPEVLAALRRIEATGRLETAQRVKQRLGQIFRYAVATGRSESDPTASLRGALATPATRGRAAITDPAAIGGLLRAIDGYIGQPMTAAALKLAPLLFVRPGNLRAMEWAELDLDGGIWRIPAGKMKMREAHTVPLASQAVAILRDLEPFTSRSRYVFPSLRSAASPMSENTINAALRRLGYDKDTMTGHGFRALASTRLNEMGWPPDVIERQLAHAERNKVRAAYNRAAYMAERTKMMQAWADYLEGLLAKPNVVAIRARIS